MFVVNVDLRIRRDKREIFLAAIEENAAASVRDEAGCLRFDVCQDNAEPDHFSLYEIYTEEDAFAAHRATPHFARWREAAAECLQDGGQHTTACTLLFSPADVARRDVEHLSAQDRGATSAD